MAIIPETSPLLAALAARGYVELTAVQRETTTDAASGRDLLVSAQTGSGKTVAYGLAIGETLLAGAERLPTAGAPLALVVAPTRELAMQVERELAWLFAEAGGRIAACVGGMDPRAERRRLEAGAHVVVGTPGRLRDHIGRGALDLSRLTAVVLDEADEMLDLGFREDLEFILEAAPAERRTLLFSATLPEAIVSIARRFQRDALRVETVGAARAHADIEHRAVRVSPRDIRGAVVNILRQQDAAAAIVFCSTREAVRQMHQHLARRGFSAVLLSGELGQGERNRAIEEIRDGRARVCVATDVASRGIDITSVELVVHADLPHDAEIFQHRSGRTGRAGRKGVSVLLAPVSRRRKAELLLADAGVEAVWTAAPTADEIRALDEERLATDPVMSTTPSDNELARARALLARDGAEAVAVALLRLHRARLPEPETVEDPGAFAPSRERPAAGPRRAEDLQRRETFGDALWFRLAIGRKLNADPKWLLPMICRRGGVTRAEIGAIRIFDRETKVAIAAHAAERFAAAALGVEKGDVLITRADRPDERAAPQQDAARRPDVRPERAFDPLRSAKGPAKTAPVRMTADRGPGAPASNVKRWAKARPDAPNRAEPRGAARPASPKPWGNKASRPAPAKTAGAGQKRPKAR